MTADPTDHAGLRGRRAGEIGVSPTRGEGSTLGMAQARTLRGAGNGYPPDPSYVPSYEGPLTGGPEKVNLDNIVSQYGSRLTYQLTTKVGGGNSRLSSKEFREDEWRGTESIFQHLRPRYGTTNRRWSPRTTPEVMRQATSLEADAAALEGAKSYDDSADALWMDSPRPAADLRFPTSYGLRSGMNL